MHKNQKMLQHYGQIGSAALQEKAFREPASTILVSFTTIFSLQNRDKLRDPRQYKLTRGSLLVANEMIRARQVMMPEEIRISAQAVSFARTNKKAIGKRRTDKKLYPAEEAPVSVFMAGSPGAGKTEASIALVNLFSDTKILRIDPDELRNEFSEYSGANSWLFQERIHDFD